MIRLSINENLKLGKEKEKKSSAVRCFIRSSRHIIAICGNLWQSVATCRCEVLPSSAKFCQVLPSSASSASAVTGCINTHIYIYIYLCVYRYIYICVFISMSLCVCVAYTLNILVYIVA